IDFGAHARVKPGDQPAAIQRRHASDEGQYGHADDQREDARQNQHFDGIAPHGSERVDFLAHFHRAEFGGVGTAGPARDHDRHEKTADLAQHQDADEIDDIIFGAEAAKMEETLLGDDAPDQEGDQHDDRYGLPYHTVEMM